MPARQLGEVKGCYQVDCDDCDICEEVKVEVKNDLLTSQCIRYEQQKVGLNQKYAINKNSTIFIQLSWYSTKMASSWVGNFDRISTWWDE